MAAVGASATTLTVNTLSDSSDASGSCTSSGACSLRDAITQAASGDTVNFSVTGTITLGSALPTISGNLTITGPGANELTISGNNSSTVGTIFTIDSATVSISGLTIANGVGECGGIHAGGGICLLGGSLTVSASTFSGNSAAYGGGIYFDGTTLIISGSTFTDNSAKFVTEPEGGAIEVAGGKATIDNDTFSGNSTTFAGGAILVFGSTTVTVTNSTFSGNSGPNGSAIFNLGALTLSNSIFSGNSAPSGGLGGAVLNDTGSTVISYNVFYNNSGGDCALCTPTNSSSGDPKLLPLGYYGGTTETLALAPGSAALCAGNSADAVDAGNNPLTADQRGFAMDPTCASGSVDAGAVQTNQYVVTTLTDKTDGTPECTSGTGTTCSLRDAMGLANSTGGDLTFLSSLTSTSSPGTINLGTGTNTPLPAITGQVNILGPGANQLTVSGNNSTSVGSVFTVNAGATALLYGLTVTGGNSTSGNGGGIYSAGTLTVLDSAVSGNTAYNGGGISSSGALTVTGSTVSGNGATGANGAGIDSDDGTLTVTESTIYDNQASGLSGAYGGGIYSYSSFTLTGSTVTGNSATCSVLCGSTGGGIYDATGTVTLANSIVAGNSASATEGGGAGRADISAQTITNDGGNLYGTSSTGSSNVNPGLSGLQYNGIGATLQTAIPLPGSPAICAGLVSKIPAGTTTDERGYPLQPAGGYCTSTQVDAGAVQTNYTSVAFVQQPTDTLVNTAITPSPTVEVLETDTLLSSNNTDAVNGVPITLAYSGGSSELPGATLTQTTAGGVATFSGLEPNTTGMGFSFSVGAGGASLEVVSGTTLTATSDTFDVTFPPSISISKSHTGTFTAGSTGVWNLVVTNNGGISTSGTVTVSDPLPSGYTLKSFTSTGNLFACSGTSTVTCTGTPDLAANGGSNTIELTVTIPANSPSSVSNTASAWGGGDPVHTNAGTAALSNTDTATVLATTTTAASNQTATFSNSNQNLTLSATVASAAGTVNAGTVTFTVLNGGTPVGTATTSATVASGSASVNYVLPAGTASGTYTIEAVYNGSTNFNGSSDSTHTLTVNRAAPKASANAYSITYGTALSNAQLSGTATFNSVSVPGTFTFTSAAGTVLNAGANQSEQVTFTPTDSTDYSAVPTTVLITVNKATLTITANNATKVYGTANPTFTGSVTGKQNGDTFTESFSTTATASSPVNTYAIVPSVTGANLADYTQSATNGTLTITQAASVTALAVSSTSITPGQSVTLTATVGDASPGSTGTPSGTVNFYDGGALLNATPAAISGGIATFATTALTPGVTHVITATYSGDTNFTTSSSTANAATNITVAPLDFTMTISGPSSATVIPGRSITYQVTVAPLYGSYAGTVNFAVSGLPAGATASFSPSSIAANGGPQTITVTITAAPVTAANHMPSPPSPVRRGIPLTLAGAFLFGIGAIRRRGKAWQRLLSITVLLAGGVAATLIGGCGGAAGFFTQAPQNYTITITATGGNLQHTASVTLNIQ